MKDSPQFNKLLPDAEWRVTSPGRVNLLGEHVDYNQGIVLPAAIDRYVQMIARPRDDRLVELQAPDLNGSVTFSLDHLEERMHIHGLPLPAWALYPAGVAWSLQSGGLDVRGVSAAYQADLPIGAGLSSSAAVELAFAALWQSLGGWALDRMRLAMACQYAENYYVGVNCGLMDQFACAHGIARHALFFDVRSLAWQPLPLPPDTAIVIADSGVRRSLANSEYNQRRADCEEAVELLKIHLPEIQSLRDVSFVKFEEFADALPGTLRMRTRHVVLEMVRVQSAYHSLMLNNALWFGRLMIEGHRSLRDLFQVSTPELDALVEIATGIDGCYGSRLTGAGFGGCTVSLVKKGLADSFTKVLKEKYLEQTGKQADVYICQPSRSVFVEKISVC